MNKLISTVTAILMLTVFCASIVYAASPEKAKQILEKTANKYSDLLKKDGKEIKSIAAKVLVKGGGNLPMGDSAAPLDINMALEIYFKQPRNLYLSLSGNLGNATLIVTGVEKKLATVLLPTTSQFARIEVPEEIMQQTEVQEDEEPPNIDDMTKDMDLSYEGTERLKMGNAHKIKLSPKDPSEEGSATLYILDGKWDPARIDLAAKEGSVVIEFDKLEVNEKVSDDQFIPKTEGYTEVSQDQLTTIIMMQVMGAMMQQSGGGGGMME